jgi:acyl carrier protein
VSIESRSQRQALVEFLNSVARPGSLVDGVDDGTNLVQAGIVDSFALIQIIFYLEQNYDMNLPALGIDPADLATIGGMLAAIARAGK